MKSSIRICFQLKKRRLDIRPHFVYCVAWSISELLPCRKTKRTTVKKEKKNGRQKKDALKKNQRRHLPSRQYRCFVMSPREAKTLSSPPCLPLSSSHPLPPFFYPSILSFFVSFFQNHCHINISGHTTSLPTCGPIQRACL